MFSIWACLLETEDQEGDGGREGADGDPEGAGPDVVAVDGGFAAALVVGGDVDHVALLDVEGRGGVHLPGVQEVELVDVVLFAVVADQGHVFALAVDRQVAGEADGIEDGEAVAVDLETAGAVDFTEDGEAEVHEFHGDDRIFDLAALDEELLDVLGGLLPGAVGDKDGADDREVDVAVGVHGVAGDTVGGRQGRTGAGRGGQGLRLTDAGGVVGEVEHRGDLGVAAVDDHGDLVVGLEPDGPGLGRGQGRVVDRVLEVSDVGRRGAGGQRGETQGEDRRPEESESGFHCVYCVLFYFLSGALYW